MRNTLQKSGVPLQLSLVNFPKPEVKLGEIEGMSLVACTMGHEP